MNEVLLFVYGTLKSGFGNNALLKGNGVKLMGKATTEPKFTMLSCGGFPAVICEGNTPIQGEVYSVTNPDVLKNVYRLEGYSGKQGSTENWYDVEEIDTPYGKSSMFVFRTPSNSLRERIVKEGKW